VILPGALSLLHCFDTVGQHEEYLSVIHPAPVNSEVSVLEDFDLLNLE